MKAMRLIKVKLAAAIGGVVLLSGICGIGMIKTFAGSAPAIDALEVPGAGIESSVTATSNVNNNDKLQILTYTTGLSYRQVCDFYTARMLPPGMKIGTTSIEGGLTVQRGYSVTSGLDADECTFCENASSYSVTAVVQRGLHDSRTTVTIVYDNH